MVINNISKSASTPNGSNNKKQQQPKTRAKSPRLFSILKRGGTTDNRNKSDSKPGRKLTGAGISSFLSAFQKTHEMVTTHVK